MTRWRIDAGGSLGFSIGGGPGYRLRIPRSRDSLSAPHPDAAEIKITASMNWLAHLQLSEPTPEALIGGLLPDLVRGPELQDASPVFQPGIREHRLIDSFTDRHPVFTRSKQRIDGSMRRFSGIIIDVFYDHFLTSRWHEYSPRPLAAFLAEFHPLIDEFWEHIPVSARPHLARMRDAGWLQSYGTIQGVATALARTGRRLKRPVDLGQATDDLDRHYEAFSEDFGNFYPALAEHVRRDRAARTAAPARLMSVAENQGCG